MRIYTFDFNHIKEIKMPLERRSLLSKEIT